TIMSSSSSSTATATSTNELSENISTTSSMVGGMPRTPGKATSAAAASLSASTGSSATGSKFIANSYTYDHLFSPSMDTPQIYDTVAKRIIWSTMEGYNGTIFAYGQTASGKTFTMKGSGKKNPGIIPMAIRDVFDFIQQEPGREFLLRVSYMEIYNEVINDLLAPESLNLKIHEKPNGEIYVGNLKEEIVLSPDHVMSLISAGEAYRHVGSTNFNEQSSRSHTIFRLVVESKETASTGSNLIDLAGSERASEGVQAIRNKEGAYINKSLLTLGSVISKLSEKTTGHINYRDSKLTRILQNSLSGNSKIAIVCTITLASNNFEETHSTLKFASRAKKITNHARLNEVVDDKTLIKQYRNEIAELKLKLEEAQRKELDLEKNKTAEELSKRLHDAEKHKNLLESKIQHLTKLILVSSSISKAKQGSTSSSSEASPLSSSVEDIDAHHISSHLKSNPLVDGKDVAKMAKLEKELEEKNKTIESDQKRIKELELKLKEKEDSVASLEFRINGYMEKFKTLISQNDSLKKQLSSTQKELEEHKLQLLEAQEQEQEQEQDQEQDDPDEM
ncbi:hypothetical protein SAMD00019534_036330, partial [Acytostelium subglobosum LB1]|uniref:hypothetical protein n=1 Tax=Acytostelium subglobosum LB1 TaxID=1410327 RepID=UPI0006447D16